MSIESSLKSIADSLEKLVEKFHDLPDPVTIAPAPAENTATPAPPFPGMPAPTTQVPQPECPFTDTNGLIQYVTTAYQSLGAEKGGKIQTKLQELGYVNINDVIKDHYMVIYRFIEELKNG